jgi:hypothetical protein
LYTNSIDFYDILIGNKITIVPFSIKERARLAHSLVHSTKMNVLIWLVAVIALNSEVGKSFERSVPQVRVLGLCRRS